MVRTNVQLVV